VGLNQAPDLVELMRSEAVISSKGKWIEPELAGGAVPLHMDVLRFVAVEAVEEEPVCTGTVFT